MTSNKSSAKSAVFSVFRTQLYSMRMGLALFALILLLLPTVMTIGFLSDEWNWIERYSDRIVSQVHHIILCCGLIPLLVMALVLAISEFGYLHKKQKLDYFHALPVRRADHYLGRALAALMAITCGALLVCLGQTVVVMSIPGMVDTTVYGVIWFDFVMMVFSAFAAYLFAVMVTVLTATLWEMLFSLLAVSAAFPLMTAITGIIIEYSIPMCEVHYGWLEITVLSPFIAGIGGILVSGMEPEALLPVLLTLAVQILVCGALGFRFFCKRHSELAESVTTRTRFKFVVRFAATVIASFIGSMTLLWITNTYAGYLVGALLGTVLAWVVLELVYTRSLRRIVRNGVPCLAGLACFAVINALVAFGLIGVPGVPETDSINAVSMDCYAQLTDGETYTLYGQYRGFDYATVYTDEQGRSVQMASFDEALIQESRDLLQAMLDDQKALYFPYHPTQWGEKNWSLVQQDVQSSYYVGITVYTEEGEIRYDYRNQLEVGNGREVFAKAQAITTSSAYVQNNIAIPLLDLLEGFTYESYSGGTYRTYQYNLAGLEDRDAAIERIKAAYLEDLTSAEPQPALAIENCYYLEFDESRPITLQGGIVDGYYPADGMECWLAPQYTPGFDPEKVDPYMTASSDWYINGDSLPRTFAVLEEIRNELDK